MELRTLHYFLAVAREENMTEAANVLHVTQPTLSRQMADLEAELGKKLFTRTNRSTVLTEEGVHLRQRAEEILSLVDQTEEEIRDDNTDLSGNIRIGAGITHLIHYLTETFAELRRDNPRLTIELWTGNADTIQEKLEHGLLDFALFIEPFHAEKYEYLRLPGKNKLGVVTSAHGPWADAGKVTPEMITQMPLMVSSRHTNRSFDLVAWSQGKVTPEKLTIVGTMDLYGKESPIFSASINWNTSKVRTSSSCLWTLPLKSRLSSPGRNTAFSPARAKPFWRLCGREWAKSSRRLLAPSSALPFDQRITPNEPQKGAVP